MPKHIDLYAELNLDKSATQEHISSAVEQAKTHVPDWDIEKKELVTLAEAILLDSTKKVQYDRVLAQDPAIRAISIQDLQELAQMPGNNSPQQQEETVQPYYGQTQYHSRAPQEQPAAAQEPAAPAYGAPQQSAQPQTHIPYGSQAAPQQNFQQAHHNAFQGAPGAQNPQGPNAFDQAAQQAAQLGATAKDSFNKASTSVKNATLQALGFLPLLIGSLLFLVLNFFNWRVSTYSDSDSFAGEVKIGVSGFGVIGYSMPSKLAKYMEISASDSMWQLTPTVVLVPLVAVALLIFAALSFNKAKTQRLGGFLALLGSIISLYWVTLGATSLSSLFTEMSDLLESEEAASGFLDLFHSMGDVKPTLFYWLAVLVVLALTGLSVILFLRSTKEEPSMLPAPAQSPQPAQPWTGTPNSNNPQQQ
ncbi:hypothetical protein EML15_01275 [Corynebacterium sp. sy017]|uniref:hypothetical protein n=1 Tax=unclassified Corynebacterium TaxID=2624378 RepID=UPI0011862C3F|nr:MULTISPECIES: hypothetical protein [unclassified Corynebacterium]MBP3087785.1 hypothetical protein [Corynebacterium sp. sy017]TSD92334.1 hypothetical protein ELY17_01275 [Corynebacterium sp. SY003]